MIEPIEDVPSNVIGLRATGEVTGEDYRSVLEPALLAGAETGDIRLLFVMEVGVSLDASALMEDAKTGALIGLRRHSAWTRTAVVTDLEAITKGIRGFGWMVPGDIAVYPLAEEANAREWVVG